MNFYKDFDLKTLSENLSICKRQLWKIQEQAKDKIKEKEKEKITYKIKLDKLYLNKNDITIEMLEEIEKLEEKLDKIENEIEDLNDIIEAKIKCNIVDF